MAQAQPLGVNIGQLWNDPTGAASRQYTAMLSETAEHAVSCNTTAARIGLTNTKFVLEARAHVLVLEQLNKHDADVVAKHAAIGYIAKAHLDVFPCNKEAAK